MLLMLDARSPIRLAASAAALLPSASTARVMASRPRSAAAKLPLAAASIDWKVTMAMLPTTPRFSDQSVRNATALATSAPSTSISLAASIRSTENRFSSLPMNLPASASSPPFLAASAASVLNSLSAGRMAVVSAVAKPEPAAFSLSRLSLKACAAATASPPTTTPSRAASSVSAAMPPWPSLSSASSSGPAERPNSCVAIAASCAPSW